MPKFAVMAKGSIEGKRNIKELKQKIIDVSNAFKAKEARIVQAYAMLGQYDYLFITAAPDLETAFELSTMFGGLGSFDCEPCPIMSLEELYNLI